MKAPAFQFYVRDWILSRAISKMSGDEVKAYVYLLCESWLEEPRATLPNDDEELARMSQTSTEKWLKVKARVMANFVLSGERYVNLKLHGISENQSQFQKWGKLGGNPKLVKKHKYEPKEVNPIVNPTVNGTLIPLVNLATASATSTASITSNKKEERALPLGFQEFWKVYPKRKAKDDALRAWNKINPTTELTAKIIKSAEDQSKSPDWFKEAGKFIPFPATWLNGARWEDEAFNGNKEKQDLKSEWESFGKKNI